MCIISTHRTSCARKIDRKKKFCLHGVLLCRTPIRTWRRAQVFCKSVEVAGGAIETNAVYSRDNVTDIFIFLSCTFFFIFFSSSRGCKCWEPMQVFDVVQSPCGRDRRREQKAYLDTGCCGLGCARTTVPRLVLLLPARSANPFFDLVAAGPCCTAAEGQTQ